MLSALLQFLQESIVNNDNNHWDCKHAARGGEPGASGPCPIRARAYLNRLMAGVRTTRSVGISSEDKHFPVDLSVGRQAQKATPRSGASTRSP